MQIVFIAIGIVAAALIGVLFDWLIKPLLPEKPTARHIISIILFLFILIYMASLSTQYQIFVNPPSTTNTPQTLFEDNNFTSNPSSTPITSTITLSKSTILYGELVFEENFETYPDSWDPGGNRIESGNLYLGSKNDLAPFGWGEDEPPIYSDFIFEVQFTFPKDSIGMEFGVRSQYPPCPGWNCSITVVVDRAVNNVFVFQIEYGEHDGPFTSASFDPKIIEFLPDQPNRITIIANGNEFNVYINDYHIIKFGNGKYRTGTFGLYNPGSTEVIIDYIRYYLLPN